MLCDVVLHRFSLVIDLGKRSLCMVMHAFGSVCVVMAALPL